LEERGISSPFPGREGGWGVRFVAVAVPELHRERTLRHRAKQIQQDRSRSLDQQIACAECRDGFGRQAFV
jgi:hypothetical protein